MNRVVFKVSAGFLVGALLLLAGALYLSDYFIGEQRRLAGAGDARGAMEAADLAVRLDPFDPEPLYLRSTLLQQQGRYEDSADTLGEAVERDPHNSLPYILLGNIQLSQLDETEAAEESYRGALEVNPRATAARSGLAQTLLRKGDLEGAKKEYEWLREQGGISFDALYDLGRIQVRTGEPMEGYRSIRRAQNLASRELDGLEGDVKDQREDLIESMDLARADALVVAGRYGQARRIIAESPSEQAPALLQLLDSDPEAYKESVVNREIF